MWADGGGAPAHRLSSRPSYIPVVLPRHLYIHVPFCARRCSYCSFAIAVRPSVPIDDYVQGVVREFAIRYPDAGQFPLDTMYFGGGTPSKLGGEGVARLLGALRARVTPASNAEITLEANPEDVSLGAARAWRESGVTRLSIGAQSFDDRVLTWMHRTHDAAAIRSAVEAARTAGFDALSLDLIFALPAALARDFERDLREAMALEPSHMSVYGLTVEPGTPVARWRERGQLREAGEDVYEREFLLAHDVLATHGLDHYEVSNYARPGHEARHNSAYWIGARYAGIGPSAHEFDGASRRWNVAAYAGWLDRVNGGRDPRDGSETLTQENKRIEEVYLGLRTADGLQLSCGEVDLVAPWVEAGWGSIGADGRLRLTPAGWLRVDALAAYLTNIRSRY